MEGLRNKNIASGLVIVAGALGAVGCGGYREATGEGMRLEGSGTLYVPGDSEGQFSTLRCDGTVLVHHIEKNDDGDSTKKYVNDDVCEDKKITPADFKVK